MNGRLKCLFHSRSRIFHQMMFNVDIRQTLQFVHHTLAEVESEPTLNFLQSSARRNMVQIGAHTYILGLVEAMEEQKSLLDADGPIEVFSGLYMQWSTYTSKSYAKGINGKRNNTVCVFRTSENDCNYGEIENFVNMSLPQAIIRVLRVQGQTILQQAGHSCRPALYIRKVTF